MKDGAGAYRALDVLLTAVLGAGWLALLLWLSLRVWTRDPAIDAGVDRVSGRWHLMTFVCFVMMSFLLIALANPRGDVQDSFIQKVKFIASHGLYALWIGYGMAYALRFLRDDRRVRAVFVPACAAVALAPLIPVHENYFNFELYDKTSAADMDGHDFGWQFGNYQLRGAPAISEELRDDEEPLPNPCYPPEMGENAVFFGGTDPGRFVPTYMIYAAHVRPDVYLITQNALADKTYLDTMRGLYADAIWMPTEYDNQVAFREYDDRIQREIREGRRDPSDTGGLTHDAQGRVSVNGALAVMEINAIIAKQIFEHNKSLHDFYVEESYAMQWMYPYLTPHGLIMKVNRDRVPLPAAATCAAPRPPTARRSRSTPTRPSRPSASCRTSSSPSAASRRRPTCCSTCAASTRTTATSPSRRSPTCATSRAASRSCARSSTPAPTASPPSPRRSCWSSSPRRSPAARTTWRSARSSPGRCAAEPRDSSP